MALEQQIFTDLILMQDRKAFLKGTPELGQQLMAVTPDMLDPVALTTLLNQLDEHFKRKGGKESSLRNIRIRFGSLSFRVANYRSVDGNAYFLRKLADEMPMFEDMLSSACVCTDPDCDDNQQRSIRNALTSFLLNSHQQKGLVLFCGSQGAGKTTLASSFVAARLRKFGGHAVTFENPVEMPLSGAHGDHGFCFQTEIVGEDELAAHIERAHRYGSPNIVYVGEIRTKFAASEALRVSLGSAQQLVVATLHGLDIATALSRLIAWAAELDGDVACHNLSQSLLAMFYQDLSPGDGKRTLSISETLFVPFHNENFRSIRSKLRDGRFTSLTDEINQQRNLMKSGFWEMEL